MLRLYNVALLVIRERVRYQNSLECTHAMVRRKFIYKLKLSIKNYYGDIKVIETGSMLVNGIRFVALVAECKIKLVSKTLYRLFLCNHIWV